MPEREGSQPGYQSSSPGSNSHLTYSRASIGFLSCAVKQVRRLPAKPKTVAAFVLEQDALGVPAQQIISILNAIELSHDRHSLSNPTATAIVRAALGQVVKIEPPRFVE